MTALENNQNITSIPIIDISGLLDNDIQTHQNIASHIRKACLDKGFFTLRDMEFLKHYKIRFLNIPNYFLVFPQNRKSSGPKSFLKQIEAMNH
jgi:isopenicillin N synthase-like dioxygenase